MNEPLHTDKGVRRFGKHSFRATGAVYLALVGISVEKIQLMGRWSCGVVVHYTRSAPLKSIAEDSKRSEGERKAVKNARVVKITTDKLINTLAVISDEHHKKYDELRSLIKYVEKQSRPREYVINRKTGNVHRILTTVEYIGSEAITYCNFRYAKAPVKTSSELPAASRDRYCATCLADVRDAMAKDGLRSWECRFAH